MQAVETIHRCRGSLMEIWDMLGRHKRCLFGSTPMPRQHFKKPHMRMSGMHGAVSAGSGLRVSESLRIRLLRVCRFVSSWLPRLEMTSPPRLSLKQSQQVLDLCFDILPVVEGALHLLPQHFAEVAAQAVQRNAQGIFSDA